MKTVQSFFPTRTKYNSNQITNDKLFHLIRRRQEPQEQTKTLDPDSLPSNIFRHHNQSIKKFSVDEQVVRPVGGLELFTRMEKAIKEGRSENKKYSKRSNKQSTQRIIQSAVSGNRFRREKGDSEVGEEVPRFTRAQQPDHKQKKEFKPQMFKSHYNYNRESGGSQKSRLSRNTHKSENLLRVAGMKNSREEQRHQRWADQQRKSYQDKTALLNQMNYNRPLVEVYGQRYFQYILRNRFQQDLKPPTFIYQIRDKFSDSKVINKLKKYRPNMLERKHLFLKGHRTALQSQSHK